jgi:hypothetical protein
MRYHNSHRALLIANEAKRFMCRVVLEHRKDLPKKKHPAIKHLEFTFFL